MTTFSPESRAYHDWNQRIVDHFFQPSRRLSPVRLSLDSEVLNQLGGDAETLVATATVKQTQKVEGQTPLFRIPATVQMRVAGEDRQFDIEIRENHHTFSFPLEEEPSQFIFDPGKHILAVRRVEKSATWWQEELACATEGIDRIYAARMLGNVGGPRATSSLLDALAEDPFWGVQAAAADALGSLRSITARDALIAAVETTEHPRARRAVVKALASFRRDASAETALTHVIRAGDPSYFVEAEACLAIGRMRGENASAVIREALSRDSFRDVIRQSCYRGLAEARDETAVSLLLDATAYGKDSQGRRAAIDALARLATGRRDRIREEIRDCIEELLSDKDFRVQTSAIEGLATIASAQSIPALNATAKRDLDGRLRRRCREVVRDIEEGRAQAEQLTSLRDELEKSRSDLAALRDRIERLETHNEQRAASIARAERPSRVSKRRPGGGKKQARPRS